MENHCPFCIQPFSSTPVLIFLGIDGVLINRDSVQDKIYATVDQLFSDRRPSELEYRIAAARHLNKNALESLDLLIAKINRYQPVHIILSSGWVVDGTLEEFRTRVFGQFNFSSSIIGKVPHDDNFSPEKKAGYDFTIAKKKYNLSLV